MLFIDVPIQRAEMSSKPSKWLFDITFKNIFLALLVGPPAPRYGPTTAED